MKISIYTKKRDKVSPHWWVYLRVSLGGQRFLVSTEISCIEPPTGCKFKKSEPQSVAKSTALSRIYGLAQEWAVLHPTATADETRDALSQLCSGKKKEWKSFVDYMEEFARTKSRESTKTIYSTTVKKVRAFDKKATFDTIDKAWLNRFESHLMSQGCGTNYISIQLRNIRAVFNYAIDNGITEAYPFRRYKIKQEATSKRNITIEQLRAVRDYQLEGYWAEYRDMFLLMFYLIGINAGDMLLLRHDDYKDGRITYKRQKTGTQYSIKVEPEAQEIIERYKGTDHLLCPMDRYKDYRDYLHHMNDSLKHIGQTCMPGVGWRGDAICPKLSSYWARHTWATIAASQGVTVDMISLALGHSFGNKVTQIYIEWSRNQVDEVNRKVLDYVKG